LNTILTITTSSVFTPNSVAGFHFGPSLRSLIASSENFLPGVVTTFILSGTPLSLTIKLNYTTNSPMATVSGLIMFLSIYLLNAFIPITGSAAV
jgi:hypothetical protein